MHVAHVGGELVSNFLEISVDVVFHEYFDVTFIVVIVKVETEIEFSLPVEGDFIVVFDGIDKVLVVFC